MRATKRVNSHATSPLAKRVIDKPSRSVIAYCVRHEAPAIIPAIGERRWMGETFGNFANRCLPMRIANQAGWFILNSRPVQIVWNGGALVEDVTVTYTEGDEANELISVSSHFGYGIVTWEIPYVFRTPSGCNLYIRGPSNWFKDGISPLEGIVETDWAVSTFTMNWKLTRVDYPIMFEKDEPVCMIFPMPRGYLEAFDAEVRAIESDPILLQQYLAWAESRAVHRETRKDRSRTQWQGHYSKGCSPSTTVFNDHQTCMTLRPFRSGEDSEKV
jgi:hypothetical protein